MWEASFHGCCTRPVSLGLNISTQETLTSMCIHIRECLDCWALWSGPVPRHPLPAGKPGWGLLWGAPPLVFQLISPRSLNKDKKKKKKCQCYCLCCLKTQNVIYENTVFENGLMIPLRKSAKTGMQSFTQKQSLKVESNAVLQESDTRRITPTLFF